MPGKARLGRLLLGPYLEARDVLVHDRYGCRYVVPSLREPVGFHLLVDGIYEFEAVEFVLSQMCEGSVFVDVGTNIGVFALPAAKEIGSSGCVLAIEPSPSIFPYLKQNLALNGLTSVRLRQCVVFDRDSERIPFYEAPIDHFGMGSLAVQFQGEPVFVPAHMLDRILMEEGITHVDLLKVDVEGFEAAVFRGAKELLTGADPPLIIFEFCDWAQKRVPGGREGDAQEVLRGYGYHIWRLLDFLRGRPALPAALTSGFEVLVAAKV
jgi:FkbM family methyltransferase